MSRSHRFIFCAAAFVVLLASACVRAQSPPSDTHNIMTGITVLPRYNHWSAVDPALRSTLKAALRMSSEQRHQLVRSGSASQRGIGIFIAEQQGDIDALLSYSDLLGDDRKTVPFARACIAPGQHEHSDQTVGEYLTAAYLEWFGVDVDSSPARYDRLFGDVSDAQHLVYPWIVRLRRAAENAERTAQVKEQISALPDRVRWAVLTLGYKNSVYERQEARALLMELSSDTQKALNSDVDLLPEEPLFRMNGGTYYPLVHDDYHRLLTAVPDTADRRNEGAAGGKKTGKKTGQVRLSTVCPDHPLIEVTRAVRTCFGD